MRGSDGFFNSPIDQTIGKRPIKYLVLRSDCNGPFIVRWTGFVRQRAGKDS